jgi:hypothetical protein
MADHCSSLLLSLHSRLRSPTNNLWSGTTKLVRRIYRSVFTMDCTFYLGFRVLVFVQWSVQTSEKYVFPFAAFLQHFVDILQESLVWGSAHPKSLTYNTDVESRQNSALDNTVIVIVIIVLLLSALFFDRCTFGYLLHMLLSRCYRKAYSSLCTVTAIVSRCL